MVTRRPGATQDEVRRHNLSTLLRAVHEAGSVTRAELTGSMGLNRSTIKDLVDELAALGAVEEQAPGGGRSSAGRPSLVVTPRADRVQVVAVDVGVDRVVVGLVGLGGTVVVRRSRRLVTTEPDVVIALVARAVEALLTDPAAARQVVGVGVSIPGAVRVEDGCVRFAPNMGWTDEPFGEQLAQRLGRAVQVGNDADLGVLAEHRRGVARGYDDVVFIAGEVGVGGGFIVGGRPLVGAGGYAGELGHMRLRTDGLPCRCGATGCWETEIGTEAIARALGLADVSTADLVRAVRREHARGGRTLDGVARQVGLGLASLVNVVNPRLVILGGVLRELVPVAGDVIEQVMRDEALDAPAAMASLTVPQLGGDAVLVGAAELAWDQLLVDPVAVLRGDRPAAAAEADLSTLPAGSAGMPQPASARG